MSESLTVFVESVGAFIMADGREVYGAIISFPPEGCGFPLSTIWQREPLKLVRGELSNLATRPADPVTDGE